MLIVFIPCTVIGSGYAGKCGVTPLYKGIVAKALQEGSLTHERLSAGRAKAYDAFAQAGKFPGYFPNLSRVEVEV